MSKHLYVSIGGSFQIEGLLFTVTDPSIPSHILEESLISKFMIYADNSNHRLPFSGVKRELTQELVDSFLSLAKWLEEELNAQQIPESQTLQ